MNIALIGPRGVGKSKISRKLSKLTGIPLLSTDMLAVYELGGKSIASFIEENHQDWSPFRDLEYQILKKLETATELILDCGGGILFDIDESGKEVLSERKVNLLKKQYTIIRLSRNQEYLLNKINKTSNRPDLSERESYKTILDRRNPIYDSVADHILYFSYETPEALAKKIISLTKLRTE